MVDLRVNVGIYIPYMVWWFKPFGLPRSAKHQPWPPTSFPLPAPASSETRASLANQVASGEPHGDHCTLHHSAAVRCGSESGTWVYRGFFSRTGSNKPNPHMKDLPITPPWTRLIDRPITPDGRPTIGPPLGSGVLRSLGFFFQG